MEINSAILKIWPKDRNICDSKYSENYTKNYVCKDIEENRRQGLEP
jgi:hypothetical protein